MEKPCLSETTEKEIPITFSLHPQEIVSYFVTFTRDALKQPTMIRKQMLSEARDILLQQVKTDLILFLLLRRRNVQHHPSFLLHRHISQLPSCS
jgi:hypothetical protein